MALAAPKVEPFFRLALLEEASQAPSGSLRFGGLEAKSARK
jgi:hypothetical protein